MSCAVFAAETAPMKFCGMQLGRQVPEGLEPSSKTELYYGYRFSEKEKILRFNQYQFHASLITKTIISAGAGYTTDSKSDAKSLFDSTCHWLEQKYPNKKCEDCNRPNRTIKVMRFGKDTDGYYMLELISSETGMYIVVLSLYNDKLSNLEEREAKEFATRRITGQSAPLQYSVYQVNSNLNQGKSIYPTFTNSIAQSSTSQTTMEEDFSKPDFIPQEEDFGQPDFVAVATPFDNTKDTMGLIRRVIEDCQQRNKTRSAPKDLQALKSIAKGTLNSWKDGWGNDFAYKCKGDRWTLQSAGADKKYDTDDDLLFICEDGMNVTTVGFPTGNGRFLDSEVVKRNISLRKNAGEDLGGRPDGWTLVDVPGFVTVDIPPTMELQKGSYKVFKEAIAKITLDLDMRDQALTFQQSGLNDHEEGSTRRYARIVFKSFFDKDQDFTLPDNKLTPDVLKAIEEDEYANIKKGFDQINRAGLFTAKLLKWFPVKKVQIGGLSGYRIAFLRQQKTFPPVYVEDYKLGNGRYLYTITFSYRQSEESFWKEDYDTIKRRIKFNLKRGGKMEDTFDASTIRFDDDEAGDGATFDASTIRFDDDVAGDGATFDASTFRFDDDVAGDGATFDASTFRFDDDVAGSDMTDNTGINWDEAEELVKPAKPKDNTGINWDEAEELVKPRKPLFIDDAAQAAEPQFIDDEQRCGFAGASSRKMVDMTLVEEFDSIYGGSSQSGGDSLDAEFDRIYGGDSPSASRGPRKIVIDGGELEQMTRDGRARLKKSPFEQVRLGVLAETGDERRYGDDAWGMARAIANRAIPYLGRMSMNNSIKRQKYLSDVYEGRLDGYDGETDAEKFAAAAKKVGLDPRREEESGEKGLNHELS